jgi:hypothetical protein
MTFGSRGTYASVGIPGTGLSYRQRIGGGRSYAYSPARTEEQIKSTGDRSNDDLAMKLCREGQQSVSFSPEEARRYAADPRFKFVNPDTGRRITAAQVEARIKAMELKEKVEGLQVQLQSEAEDYRHVVFQPARMSMEELQAGADWVYAQFYRLDRIVARFARAVWHVGWRPAWLGLKLGLTYRHDNRREGIRGHNPAEARERKKGRMGWEAGLGAYHFPIVSNLNPNLLCIKGISGEPTRLECRRAVGPHPLVFDVDCHNSRTDPLDFSLWPFRGIVVPVNGPAERRRVAQQRHVGPAQIRVELVGHRQTAQIAPRVQLAQNIIGQVVGKAGGRGAVHDLKPNVKC